jgi:regulatory protein
VTVCRNRADGSTVTDQDLNEKELARARDAAYRHLSYRPRSREEVRRKLQEKGFSGPLVDAVLSGLERLGYVNDREFALQWARARIRLRSFGKRRIEQELRDRGIDRDLIQDALSEAFEAASELELARAEAEKKMKTLVRFRPEVRRRRVAGLLERKGFPASVVYSVIKELED